MLKGLVESVFVVGSILLALAVDEWAQDREYAELADQTLGIFEREILQNRARMEDSSPYHQGIRDLLGQMRELPEPPMDIRSIMEGLSPPVLLNTAWETALATGALTHMEFDVVSALSLTYSIQEAFENRSRLDRPRFSVSEMMEARQRREQVGQAFDYVSALTRDESELLAVYDQALEVIAAHRMPGHSDEPPDSGAAGAAAGPLQGG